MGASAKHLIFLQNERKLTENTQKSLANGFKNPQLDRSFVDL